MDFTKTEASQDLSGLVRTIVDSVCTPAHQRTLDALDQRFDETLWEKLIHADVLSTAAPEDIGGGGFGVLEQAAILTALGRQLAAVPYLESVVLGAGALSRFGSQELARDWAAPAAAGLRVLAVALDGELGQAPVAATARSRAEPGRVAVSSLNGVTPARPAPLCPAATSIPEMSRAASAAANGPVSST